MRFQRAADDFLRRFGDATSHWTPDAIAEMWGGVLPVMLLGEDRVDYERRTFTDGYEVGPTGAGRLAQFALQALTGDIEVLAFGFGRPSSPNTIGYARMEASDGTASAPGGSNGGFVASAPLSAALPTVLRGPAGETLFLPVRGLLIPRGQQLAVATTDLTATAYGWAAWRNIGPAT